ncbi:DNA polymerase family B, exonuclease domain [Methanobrevibacter cuticularis]|uniref:DNA polymerase family B, exonuclease domain n=1 Tax=Methanobrevibacter cuticularis TaxID=47311 RepID=A0A166FCQ4_9EURY|nr:ribonuclease H-like domain-containing protein [Methanobrevibacter cuticularis]KZX17542.1 DNA polymerase family B, exonuclease domain [Methanobrevibacter cuticularis]
MPSNYETHKDDILKSILSKSLSSKNPSKETIAKAHLNSNNSYTELKEKLLTEYQNQKIDDIEGSEIFETKSGETLKIVRKQKIDFSLKENDFKKHLFSDLTLVPKIGQVTEQKLLKEGYTDIPSLLEHEKFSQLAQIAIDKIESSSFVETFHLVRKNSYSPNNVLKCAGSVEEENFKFMDIETLGLSNVPIILMGLAEIKGKYIESTQYLLRDKIEEPALLEGFNSHLDEDSVFVTYNGASFDIPFIKNRFNYYRMDYSHNLINYDLLYFARRLWKNQVPDCKLTTIESHLFDINRVDDVPGSQIPKYYETYLKKNNIGPLVPIIEHNRMDIVSLASFLMRMCDEIN